MPTGSIRSVRNILCSFALRAKWRQQENDHSTPPPTLNIMFAGHAIYACKGRRCLWSSSPSSPTDATKSAPNKGAKRIFNIFLLYVFAPYFLICLNYLYLPHFFGREVKHWLSISPCFQIPFIYETFWKSTMCVAIHIYWSIRNF